jgi:DNA recombination protein RmuC
VVEMSLVVAGVVAGAGLAWLAARAHFLALARAERAGLESRVTVAEGTQDDLRKQAIERELRISELSAQLDRERSERVQSETRLDAARESLDAQRRLIDEARDRLTETFKAASADVLRTNATAFLDHARESLEAQLGRRQDAIEGLMRPLEESLRRTQEYVRELERARQQAYGTLEERLRSLADQSRELQRETGSLAAALRASQARGRWGEMALRRIVELAGMTSHSDFVEQVTVDGEAGRLRPDMVVRLPAGREIVIDAKAPLTAYLEGVEAGSSEARSQALARHAQALRSHMTQLAAKAYWKQFGQSAELVVMFIPGEAFVAAAVEADRDLLADAMERRVVIATPVTLFALLAAIAYGWQQQQAAQNAEKITQLGRELYDRLRTLGEHFDAIGASLRRGVDAYNKAVGSMDRMVLPAARRFRDLGSATGKDIPTLEPIDVEPRRLTAPDLPAQLDIAEAAEAAGTGGDAAPDQGDAGSSVVS